MRRNRGIAVLLLSLLAACSERGRYGRVSGEAYLVPNMGRQIDLPNMPVRLVEEVDRFDSLLAPVCDRRDARIAQGWKAAGGTGLPHPDSLQPYVKSAFTRAWIERSRVLSRIVRRETRTDAHTRYLIDSIPPGRYGLWADTVIRGEHWTWLAPVWIRGGDTLHVSLTSGNVDDSPFRCRP